MDYSLASLNFSLYLLVAGVRVKRVECNFLLDHPISYIIKCSDTHEGKNFFYTSAELVYGPNDVVIQTFDLVGETKFN